MLNDFLEPIFPFIIGIYLILILYFYIIILLFTLLF